MPFFFDTVETIPAGAGFAHYGSLHLCWLAVFAAFAVLGSLCYRRCGAVGRGRWRKTLAALIVADELFKMACLFIGGNYSAKYLPLHLCSINIFLIALHACKPRWKGLGNYLYMVGIPGAISALLFPSWAELPLQNFMHIHSFTIHILLAAYPIIVTAGGDIKPDPRQLPRCLLLLAATAVPLRFLNPLLGTNFMFLNYAEPGTPLVWFARHWGSHLLGFPVLIAAVIIIMHLPPLVWRKLRAKITA